MKYTLAVLAVTLSTTMFAQQIDIQGHRGARGIKPENTIPAFIYALEQGVTTLELDVVITKDKKVLVSHEPWMSSEICLSNDGSLIGQHNPNHLNIYKLTYAETTNFDCGSHGNERFPEQEKLKVQKPLLSDVFKAVEHHIKSNLGYEVDYNIEIKSTTKGDNIYHPTPAEFSDLVYELIDQYLPWDRIFIQSFDFRVLQYWHKKYPDVQLVALIENLKSIDTNLANLGFKPHVYSPYYPLLSKKNITALHKLGIKVIPWTVNEPNDMTRLVEWGVDGIITDYPNRAKDLGLTLPDEDESK